MIFSHHYSRNNYSLLKLYTNNLLKLYTNNDYSRHNYTILFFLNFVSAVYVANNA